MRRAIIVLIVGLLAAFMVACGDDEPEDAGTDTGTSAEDGSMEDHSGMDMQEFVSIDGGEDIVFSSSCVDSSGTYNAELPDGGVFIFRNGGSSDSNIVDFQPSADADPLSSQTPEDTIVTVDGTHVNGTSTVTTEDGANSLSLDFGIVVDEANSC